MVAPSDMMDGRVRAIRETLDENGFQTAPIMSYAVKYASAFYGPFRDAAGSAPSFGDRKGYQMDYHNSREGHQGSPARCGRGRRYHYGEAGDVISGYRDEGARRRNVPVAAYSVSGEYAMVKAGAAMGYIDEDKIICETAVAAYRAGCDMYLTYYAPEIAKFMKEGRIG